MIAFCVYQLLWKSMEIKRRDVLHLMFMTRTSSKAKLFNSTLEWSYILPISLFYHWNYSSFYGSKPSNPSFILSLWIGLYFCVFPCSNYSTQGIKMFSLKSKSDYGSPLPWPFQKFCFVLRTEIGILNLICLLLWPQYFSQFPPLHVWHCIHTS